MEQILLEAMSRHTDGRKVIRESQHGFIIGKSSLNNLLAFYNEMMELLNKGRATADIYLEFCKAIEAVLHNTFVSKSERYGFDGSNR
ncbi:rna-directed dna polymerase from mobile element jockey- hypothetical protein [Limosa lapponica baueri]|uniref:Reverse transcriptase domain-containing protein n=1 Tax=Limosa lapponica baueri TaxID=1758121 RepID=A0A2I0U532_LIMLA|nr:rna-directed dna polymerase from mobile element jockey- hypothetical protein [Limosa lapponica baueri]